MSSIKEMNRRTQHRFPVNISLHAESTSICSVLYQTLERERERAPKSPSDWCFFYMNELLKCSLSSFFWSCSMLFRRWSRRIYIIGFLWSANHLIIKPFCKTFLEGIFHPFIPTALSSFRNGKPTSLSSVLFWPTLELLFHKQSKHGSFTQTFWTKLVLEGFAFEFVLSQKMLKYKVT